MTVAISVEHVSKQYRLGTLSGSTALADLRRWWGRARGRTDPTRTVKREGDRQLHNIEREAGVSRPDEFIWALHDVTFRVAQGEAVGIIGRNGAGKSTLLKILSRVTAPTSGIVRAKGRVASLLEVGTGFHPELTGRENAFLNGAILGMSRAEVRRKFDEIVDFSGVEQFIDTPVKRYSSGMYVRLAFAVAAHLEPEILIVDEVLAVGDTAFQKKCLGKMDEVAHGGRTVLFVSHNMSAVVDLCKSAFWLEKGRIALADSSRSVVAAYTEKHTQPLRERRWDDPQSAPGNDTVRMVYAGVGSGPGQDPLYWTVETPLLLTFRILNRRPDVPMYFNFQIYNKEGMLVFNTASRVERHPQGLIEGQCRIPENFLNDNSYTVTFSANYAGTAGVAVEDVLAFDINDVSRDGPDYYGRQAGVTRPQLEWRIARIETAPGDFGSVVP
jgi:lipopolysaccharide transport system ATP-binding protein